MSGRGPRLAASPPPANSPMADGARIASIDGVRAIAIAVVVAHNASFIIGASESGMVQGLRSLAWGGWVGVQLFFVLSGFLITGILRDALGSPAYLKTFYLRRTLRIFPLYYATLATALVVIPLLPGGGEWAAEARRHQLWFWIYASNWTDAFGRDITGFNHFWSLAVEEQFYLVWPVVVLRLTARRLLQVCVGMMMLAPIIRLCLHFAGAPPLAISEFTIARMDALAAGGALAILYGGQAGRDAVRRWAPAVGSVAALIVVGLFLARRGFEENDLAIQVMGQTPIILVSLWLLQFSLDGAPRSRLRRVLESAPLQILGKYSYAMYVFHWPIHLLVSRYLGHLVNGGSAAKTIVGYAAYAVTILALSLAAAAMSWRILEAPFLRLKDRVAPRRLNPAGSPVAP